MSSKEKSKRNRKGQKKEEELSIAKNAEVQNWRGGKAEFMLSATGAPGGNVCQHVSLRMKTIVTLHAVSALGDVISPCLLICKN